MNTGARYTARKIRDDVWRALDGLLGKWCSEETTESVARAVAEAHNERYAALERQRAADRVAAIQALPPTMRAPNPVPAPPLGHTRVSRPSAIFAAPTRNVQKR